MEKKKIILGTVLIAILLIGFASFHACKQKEKQVNTKNITATVLSVDEEKLTIQDKDNVIYTLNVKKEKNALLDIGLDISIEYTGLLNKSKEIQDISVMNYKTLPVSNDEDGIPTNWLDKGLFSNFYILAKDKVAKMTLDEKIGQLFLVRYPDTNAIEDLKTYQFGGYIFFGKDFKNKTTEQVQNMMSSLQKVAKIPILTAVDEEGGSVVRVSSNPNLASEQFKSSQDLYNEGGFNLIKEDTEKKSKLLNNLGLNLNLAPVVDVSTDPDDYMYARTLGKNTDLTSTYAKTVIEASKGTGVSYTLKHFPGYGNNEDTHNGSVIDNRSYDSILNNDLPPFKAGIDADAEAILVSHNTVTNIDDSTPASLSPSIHNLLRNDLSFTGIIMTDDLAMGATSNIPNAAIKAILAGNDLIITTDYQRDIASIKSAVEDGTISEALIDKLAFRVIAWKYYKGLMFEVYK